MKLKEVVGTIAGDDTIISLVVYEITYEDNTDKPIAYNETKYSVPDGNIEYQDYIDGNGVSTGYSDGLVWTYYYEYCEIVKITVTFTNGTVVNVRDYDELGRWKYGFGYGVGDNEELEFLEVSEYIYDGNTDNAIAEKITDYSVPDGEIVGEWTYEYNEN
jgi:hypothetical protein